MMKGDGAALMYCGGDDGGKSEGEWRLVKEAKDGEKEGLILKRERSLRMQVETDWEAGFGEESVRVHKLLGILDEHCLGRGDRSIAGG
jgi:hypothetical protein